VPEPGLVTLVHVAVWDRVREGQPLFTLDTREIEAQRAIDEANVLVAEATLKRLQDQLARLRAVDDARAVSIEEVRTREHDVSVAEAQLTAARAQVAQDRIRLERMVVRAPRASTILQVNIRAGEYAAATPKDPVILLGDVECLHVRADVDEQNASRFQPGQPATGYLKGDSTMPFELRFVRIEPYVVPKVSLTGGSTERVDTRVLQVIYAFEPMQDRPVYIGQQVDLYVKSAVASVAHDEHPQQVRNVAAKVGSSPSHMPHAVAFDHRSGLLDAAD
jgi:HlyD family secretion protein